MPDNTAAQLSVLRSITGRQLSGPPPAAPDEGLTMTDGPWTGPGAARAAGGAGARSGSARDGSAGGSSAVGTGGTGGTGGASDSGMLDLEQRVLERLDRRITARLDEELAQALEDRVVRRVEDRLLEAMHRSGTTSTGVF